MSKAYSIIDDPNYRPNVGLMLVNRQHQILAGEAIHYQGQWMMPQGGIDNGETPHQAMKRELVEETGITYGEVNFLQEDSDWHSYLFRKPLVKDGILYIGQRQKWFLLEYNGGIPDAHTTIDREFLQFQWVNPDWLLRHTTKLKIEVYQSVLSSFERLFP